MSWFDLSGVYYVSILLIVERVRGFVKVIKFEFHNPPAKRWVMRHETEVVHWFLAVVGYG